MAAWGLMLAAMPARAQDRAPSALTKGPYLTELSESGVDVRFELAASSPAGVEVRRERAGDPQPRSFDDRAEAAWHVVPLSGLSPATRYAYAVRVRGKVVAQGHFVTAPVPASGATVRFLAYGDDRSDPAAHEAVVRALSAAPGDFLVNTGDLVEDGGRAEDWKGFFDIEAPLLRDRALFVAIGNHELFDDRAGTNFARYFAFLHGAGGPRAYGTARIGNTRFFFLNAMHDWSGGDERAWLEGELARADGEAGLVWRIVVTHHGPWSSGPHGPNVSMVASHVPELLSAHHVDLVLAGHDHVYERGESGTMKYVVSGGGGAPLYRAGHIASTRKAEATYHFIEFTAATDSLRLTARRVDGSVLDECGFRKGADWDCDPPPATPLVPAASAHANSAAAPSDSPAAPPAPARKSSLVQCACVAPGGPARVPWALFSAAAFAALRVARSRGPRARGRRAVVS